MQYYLNGFRAGDPDIKDAIPGRSETISNWELPDTVDVLIVGCGPAGLCLAAQLARIPEIATVIVEAKPGPIEKGQADGISVRSMEMFQTFGFSETVKRESYWVNQSNIWSPDFDNPEHIIRTGRVQDVADDLSEMPHTLMNQARVHELFLNVMKNGPTRLKPNYNWAVRDLKIDESSHDYPVTVTLENTGDALGERKSVRARYVVGCDGARSTVRNKIGGQLHGDAAHQAWGVMDVLANTDFPDIRQKCLVSSAYEGNIMILPREGGYLFRMYVELDKLNPEERLENRNFSSEDMIAAANRILRPYSIDVKEIVWWSIYEIGHRITDRFDNLPQGASVVQNPRVFTAGDACHTHSPKSGQGMNTSMGDTFNLGWKLTHVLLGYADPSLLRSYSEERWVEAKRLIDTDHEWARVMSASPDTHEIGNSGNSRIQKHFVEILEFMGGLTVKYDQSSLIGPNSYQALATGQEVGRRFHSAPVVRLSDAKQMQLGHVAEADARWRIYAFARAIDSTSSGSAIHKLSEWLEFDPESPIIRYSREEDDIDGLFDVRAVFQQTFEALAFEDLPSLLKPRKGKFRLLDFEKAFCVDHKGLGDIFEMRGIDRKNGCMIVVRPDQYIAHILPIDGYSELTDFFSEIFLPANVI